MQKLNNKGYMFVEIIVASVISLVIAYFLINITIKMVNLNSDYYIESILEVDKNLITKEIMDDINSKELIKVKKLSGNIVEFTFKDNDLDIKKTLEVTDNVIRYNDFSKKISNNVNVGNIKIKTSCVNGNFDENNWCTDAKAYLTIDIPIYTNYSSDNFGINIVINYLTHEVIVEIPDGFKPELTTGLIPVMYYDNNWVVADKNNKDETYRWYDYDNKIWANAILATETLRNSLTKDSEGNYTPGQAIGDSEDEGVLAFYVWIPRYKYKVWNIEKEIGTDSYNAYKDGIDIVFIGNVDDEEGTITCEYDFAVKEGTGLSEECIGSNGDYYTHPAFTFDNQKLTGFWVGKFELSSEKPTSEYGGGSEYSLTPRILPNVNSWKNNNLDNFFKVVSDMQKDNNIYGLLTDTSLMNSHIITNLEWGALAYLTHSKYGRCDDNNCEEITINNSGNTTNFVTYTGRSAGNNSSHSNYGSYTYDGKSISNNGDIGNYVNNKTLGTSASSTGNIYGVYDLSGGSWEYAMANSSVDENKYEYNPGKLPNNYYTYTDETVKYLNAYSFGNFYSGQNALNRTRLGDATAEVSIGDGRAWNGDTNYVPYYDRPWFSRGGSFYNGNSAGIFYSSPASYAVEYNMDTVRAIISVFK